MQDDEKVRDLYLSPRAKRVLLKAGVDTVGKLKSLAEERFESIVVARGCGRKTLNEIANFWKEMPQEQFLPGLETQYRDADLNSNLLRRKLTKEELMGVSRE